MKKLLVLAVTLVAAAGISVAIATASPSTSRGGDLHVTKACGDTTGILFCTITGSNLTLIKAGSRVIYFQDPGATTLDSDIALVVGPGNYALGHVVLDLATGDGVVTLSGGAGQFASFHAKVRVTPPGGANPAAPGGVNGTDWAWDGWYRFGGHD